MANEYIVARNAHGAARQDYSPCAACCWVEVYDRDPAWDATLAVRAAWGGKC